MSNNGDNNKPQWLIDFEHVLTKLDETTETLNNKIDEMFTELGADIDSASERIDDKFDQSADKIEDKLDQSVDRLEEVFSDNYIKDVKTYITARFDEVNDLFQN